MPIQSPKSLLQSLQQSTIRDAADLRAKLVPDLKSFLEDGRAEAETKLLESHNVLICDRYLCEQMDQLVQIVDDAVTQHLLPAANPSASERLAMVAAGAYRRGSIASGSD